MRAALTGRAFIRDQDLDLLEILFTEVPRIVRSRPRGSVRELADAYGWFCYALWQGESAFVAFPQNYALYLLACLRAPERSFDPAAQTIARLFRPNTDQDDNAGCNAIRLRDPQTVQQGEAIVAQGAYEAYLTASGRSKYAQFAAAIEQDAGFVADLDWLRQLYPKEMAKPKLYRTQLPERNWVRDAGASFNNARQTFQALFDLFCWKYFLYGMSEAHPLPQMLSVNITPLGTQIFIPGYLSLDPKRDINFAAIRKLHRARGVRNQGPALAQARRDRKTLSQRARELESTGRRRGLRGERLYAHIRAGINRPDADDREIRRLLNER